MKNYILSFSIFLFVLTAYGQQTPQFTQFLENRYMLNPATTGLVEDAYGTIGYRKQWAGFGEEPTTFYVGLQKGIVKTTEKIHQPLALRTSNPSNYHFTQKEAGRSKVKHGLAGYFTSDSYGDFKKSGINASYAAHFDLSKTMHFAVGSSIGYNNLIFAGGNHLEVATDATYDRFATENNQRAMFDLNIGAYLYHDQFFVGYSTGQLLGDKISFNSATVQALKTHHNIMAGYIYTTEKELKLTTSAYLKSVAESPLTYDINVRMDYKKYIAGITYRSQDAIALMAGYQLSELIRLSYSYDLNTSHLNQYSAGGHEVVLGVKLNK